MLEGRKVASSPMAVWRWGWVDLWAGMDLGGGGLAGGIAGGGGQALAAGAVVAPPRGVDAV